jgi:hypothetical protein
MTVETYKIIGTYQGTKHIVDEEIESKQEAEKRLKEQRLLKGGFWTFKIEKESHKNKR